MKQSEVARHRERVAEQIAVLLLSLDPDPSYDEDLPHYLAHIAFNAGDMAYRARNALDSDPSWWEVEGRPHFNSRMARIRRVVRKRQKVEVDT